jgi:Tfp pilus assembly protein PilX
MNPTRVHRNEHGIALVMAMLILLVMSLLALVLMAGASLNRGLAGNDQRMRGSLNIAEAGVGEALARIRNQETLMDPADPADVCQVFNTVPGSVPALGADSIGLATGQPVGAFMEYTTPTRGPDVLTVAWKKNTAGTAVMRYDPAQTPKLNTVSGSPVYVITATGRVNNARRTVITEVIAKPYNINAKGALVADIPIGSLGTAAICGYDHTMDTPVGDGKNGRPLDEPSPDPDNCQDNEKPGGVGLPGMWGSSTIDPGGAFQGAGNPAWLPGQTGFYAGPWDVFNMSQSEWWSLVGSPVDYKNNSNWNGCFNLDNDGVTQNGSEDCGLQSVGGEGLLYIDGDFSLNSNFNWKGLIYVEGDFKINGSAWVLGSIIVKGQTSLTANGGMTLLYSRDAIEQMLTKYGGQFVTLSWREK